MSDDGTIPFKRLSAVDDREAEIARLREALRIARLHAPLIRLAPERRYVIATLDAVLLRNPPPEVER